MRRVLISLLALVSMIPFGARAQVKLGGEAAPVKMKATADLTLRKAPPSGLLNASGDVLGTVNKGDTVTVTGQKTVQNLFGKYTWAEVQVLDPATHKTKASGWVYEGDSNNMYLTKVNNIN